MTLQLLVENAIKHNTANTKQPLYISIQTEGNDREAQVVIRNNLQIRNSDMGYKAMMSMSKDFQANNLQEESTHLGLHNLSNAVSNSCPSLAEY